MWRHQEDTESNKIVDAYLAKHYWSILTISGLYPKMDKKNRTYSIIRLTIYVLILAHSLSILVNSNITLYSYNMILFSQNVHFCLLMIISLVVIVSCVWNSFNIFHIHKIFSYGFYAYDEPPVEGEELLCSTMQKEIRRFNIIPIGVGLAAVVALTLTPIIDFNIGTFDFNKTSSVFDHQLPLRFTKYPYNVKDGFGYYSAIFGQLVTGCIMAGIIGGAGFMFIAMAENICLQLKILNNSLDNIETRIAHLHSELFGETKPLKMKSLRYDSRYAHCYTKCLRKNFQHHQVILKAFDYLQAIASLPMGGSYLTGTIVIALSMISAGSARELPGTTTASMVMCAVEVGYMYLFSFFGQRFTDLSTELRYKVYNTKWYICSKEIKSSLMIFQEKTLKPMTLTAANIIPANMDTFATVMNASYSYYNLLHVFNKN